MKLKLYNIIMMLELSLGSSLTLSKDNFTTQKTSNNDNNVEDYGTDHYSISKFNFYG